MKKMHLQILALALCLVMSAGLLGSCGQDGTEPSPGGATATPSAPSKSEQPTDAPDSVPTLPIVDTPVEITYWFPMGNGKDGLATFGDIECAQIYETMTNVKVEYLSPMAGEEQTQFSLIIAGGDYPDMASHTGSSNSNCLYTTGAAQAIDDGVFLELTDVIDQYMPNYKREREANDDRLRWTKMDDSRIWAVFTLYDTPEPGFCGVGVNQYVWDNAGLELPVTIDDWNTQVTQIHDETGGYLFFDSTGLPMYSLFVSAWDIGADFYIDNKGDIQYGPLQDKFLDYLTEINDWYARGLIHPDFAASPNNRILGNKENLPMLFEEKYIGGVGYHSSMANRYVFRGQTDNTDYWMTPVTPPVLTEGQINRFGMQQPPVKRGNNIFADCKNVEVIARWLDYLYSPEGQLFLNYGVEGKHWEYGEDDQIYTTDYLKYPEDESMLYPMWMQSRLFGYEFPGVTYLDFMQTLSNNSGWRVGEDPEKELPPYTSFYAGEIWDSHDNSATIPSAITPSAEDSAEFSRLYADISVYLSENVVQFIMGTKSLEDFDAFREQIKSMGIDECIAIRQRAYDAFMNR